MVLFAFFAAMAETERENMTPPSKDSPPQPPRESTAGRPPPVITADMLHTVLRRRAC